MGTINVGSGAGGPSKNKKPDNYQPLTFFTANTSWTVPQTNWYRIFCFGASGDGAQGGRGSDNPTTASKWKSGGAGGSGGNSGGTAVSQLYLKKGTVIEITANKIASFGSELSATNSGTGPNDFLGKGVGGNIVQASGYYGGAGGGGSYTGSNPTRYGTAGKAGGNAGGSAGSSSGLNGGGGGGGARYESVEPLKKYVMNDVTASPYLTGGSLSTKVGTGYYNYAFSLEIPITAGIQMTGGGGGGLGAPHGSGGLGSLGGAGQPATVIIEQGVYN